MALIVADTGPVIALAKIGQLAVLQALFTEVTLPEAVWLESQVKSTDDSILIAQAVEAGWMKVVKVNRTRSFPLSLHDGEIEALQLACDRDDVLLILDDQLARREAVRLTLNFIGTVRVLALTEQRGVIASALDSIRAMQQCGYHVSAKFLNQE